MQLGPVVELTSGVDALYLSGRAALSTDFLDHLNSLRLLADEQEGPVEIVFAGLVMQMQPRKWGLYRYCLDHPYARFGFSPKDKIPAIRVQPRAEFLHGFGVENVVQWTRDLLESECGAVLLEVSRIDLFADFQGWKVTGDDRREFLCRADARNLFENAEEFNGLKIGKRESGTISARLYDKTIESTKSGTAYWKELWGEKFDPASSVLRVEFELHREVLRQFGVTTPDEVLAATGAMWHYLAHEWLTHRVPTSDVTRSRWPISGPWQAVQRARISGGSLGIERAYGAKQAGVLANLMPSLVGQLANFGALTGASSMIDLIPNLERQLNYYSRTSGRAMSSRITEKKEKYGLP
jgi:fermentation-respiration switch protein FrsA (DUF1100 family)